MMSLRSIRARLEKVEARLNPKPPQRFVSFVIEGEYATDTPDDDPEKVAALAKARAKWEAENGPINDAEDMVMPIVIVDRVHHSEPHPPFNPDRVRVNCPDGITRNIDEMREYKARQEHEAASGTEKPIVHHFPQDETQQTDTQRIEDSNALESRSSTDAEAKEQADNPEAEELKAKRLPAAEGKKTPVNPTSPRADDGYDEAWAQWRQGKGAW